MEDKKLLFSAKGITKHFAATQALKGVDLDIYEGEIVGLVGENGAGKSTLLKIIIGAQDQTGGTLSMHGKPYAPKNPMDANKEGVGMVFQEQSLIVNLSVGQNIFFGHEGDFRTFGVVNWGRMYKAAQQVLEEVDIKNINPRKKVSDLNFATRQMVEIAKVINVTKGRDGRKCLILLDEPTSVLNESEVKNLFVQIRKITALGHSVVFVSHRLDEILEVTDRVYVYKDGASVGTLQTKDASEAILYEMMVGRSTTSEYYKLDKQGTPQNEVLLQVESLGLSGVFKDINFSLRRGEILGICGVVGSGKEEVCEVICGDERPTRGSMAIAGKPVNFAAPAQGLKNGVLMIPKERLVEGIVGALSVQDNMALSNLGKLSKAMFVSKQAVARQAAKWIERMRIKTPGPKALLMQLSGGNQQKVVFSRALASECDVLILNHPTRGVDVGAKEEIYGLIRDIVNLGKAVILLGDTLDECIGMSNRVLVMRDGLITGEFDAAPGAKPSQVDVVSLMM